MKRFQSFAFATPVIASVLLACGDSPSPVAPPPPRAQAPVTEAPAPPPPAPESAPSAAPAIDIPSLGAEAASAGEGTLNVAGVSFDVAPSWEERQPSSRMRLAQYALPGEAGEAELTVFAFGVGQGGPLQENIARWAGQFADPDTGQPPQPQMATQQQGDLTVTTVTLAGTYNASMGPMMPATPQPDSALFGVIAEGGPQGIVFVKVTGPEATVDSNREALEAFAASAVLAP